MRRSRDPGLEQIPEASVRAWLAPLDKLAGQRRTARRDSQLFTPTSRENFELPNLKEALEPEENPQRCRQTMETALAKAKQSIVTAVNKTQRHRVHRHTARQVRHNALAVDVEMRADGRSATRQAGILCSELGVMQECSFIFTTGWLVQR